MMCSGGRIGRMVREGGGIGGIKWKGVTIGRVLSKFVRIARVTWIPGGVPAVMYKVLDPGRRYVKLKEHFQLHKLNVHENIAFLLMI